VKHVTFTVIALALVASQLSAANYDISVHSVGKKLVGMQLSIQGDTATATVGDLVEHFDLKQMRWQNDVAKQWISLSQCKTWGQQSKERSAKSTVKLPEKIRAFIAWNLDPKFEVKETATTLTLTSGYVDYTIVGEKTDRDLTNYYRYARLNAYKKAMTLRKLPHFAELKVLDELERRKMIPRSMEVRMPAIAQIPTMTVKIRDKHK
jgi:hypothetical protein